MENNFQDFIASHTDAELLSLAYRFDALQPDLQPAAEEELRRRNTMPPDFEQRKQLIIEQEDEILSEGKEARFPQQFFGWLGIFGILGIIIGYDLYFSKMVSRYTGKVYHEYDEQSRESGRYMFYVSLLTHSLFILYKVVPWVESYFNLD